MSQPSGRDAGRRLAGWVGGWTSGLGRGVVGGVRWPEERLAEVQTNTVRTLVVSQALGGVGISIGIAAAALLAEEVSGSEKLAGLMQTFQVLGAALASYLLARLMGVRGRRVGIATGYVLGAVGSLLCVVAGAVGSFPLLLLGGLLLGSVTAVNAQSRYAATDLARPERRARSLAMVVWATTIGAVAGPNLTGPAGNVADSLGLPLLTGPFLLGTIGILAAALVVSFRLRPDPLLVAREAALSNGAAEQTGTSWGRVRAVLREHPTVTAGVIGLSLAHGVMVAVMVMTPLHMHHGGATLEVIGLVISAHVLGMFAFSPVVGWAADRFGRVPVLMAGSLVLLAALALGGSSPAGASWQISVGLFLLGLGWSLATVAASTMLSESTPLDARTDVQGAADLTMGLTAAAAGAIGGVIVGTLGYTALNVFAGLLAAGVATVAEVARRAPEQGADAGRFPAL